MTTFTDELRADLWKLIGNRPLGVVATEMHINRWTLSRFLVKREDVSARNLVVIDNYVRCAKLQHKPTVRVVKSG